MGHVGGRYGLNNRREGDRARRGDGKCQVFTAYQSGYTQGGKEGMAANHRNAGGSQKRQTCQRDTGGSRSN